MRYEIPIVRIQLIRDGTMSMKSKAITNPRDAAQIIWERIGLADREVLIALHLDSRNRVLSIETIADGELNVISISMREVFKGAILANAAAIILGHNPPSGDSRPSYEDKSITFRFRGAGKLLGIPVLDHIIVTPEKGNWFSFKIEES